MSGYPSGGKKLLEEWVLCYLFHKTRMLPAPKTANRSFSEAVRPALSWKDGQKDIWGNAETQAQALLAGRPWHT